MFFFYSIMGTYCNIQLKILCVFVCYLMFISKYVFCQNDPFGNPCSSFFEGIYLPCICDIDSSNGTTINCDGVTFQREFPVLPHR